MVLVQGIYPEREPCPIWAGLPITYGFDAGNIQLTNWHCGMADVFQSPTVLMQGIYVMAIYQRMIARHYQRMIARQKEPYFFSEEEV